MESLSSSRWKVIEQMASHTRDRVVLVLCYRFQWVVFRSAANHVWLTSNSNARLICFVHEHWLGLIQFVVTTSPSVGEFSLHHRLDIFGHEIVLRISHSWKLRHEVYIRWRHIFIQKLGVDNSSRWWSWCIPLLHILFALILDYRRSVYMNKYLQSLKLSYILLTVLWFL